MYHWRYTSTADRQQPQDLDSGQFFKVRLEQSAQRIIWPTIDELIHLRRDKRSCSQKRIQNSSLRIPRQRKDKTEKVPRSWKQFPLISRPSKLNIAITASWAEKRVQENYKTKDLPQKWAIGVERARRSPYQAARDLWVMTLRDHEITVKIMIGGNDRL